MRLFIRRYLALSVVTGIFLLIGILSLNLMNIYTPDSARYLVWANSLAKLEGFKDATGPEITRYVIHAPLYPILLAPSAFIFPNSIVAAKLTTLLFGCLTIILFFYWLKQVVDEKYALIGSVVLALNPLMFLYSTQILSDIPFAVCLILFFLFGEKLMQEECVEGRIEAIFISAIVAGIFLREIGLALMLGATAFFLWKKQYQRASLVFLVSFLFYIAWFIRNEIIIAGIENPPMRNTQLFFMHLYTPHQASLFEELWERLWSNISVYKSLVGKLLFIPDFISRSYSVVSTTNPFVGFVIKALPLGQYVLYVSTFGSLAIGVWHQWKYSKTFLFVILFLLCYLGPLVLYPINDIRFLFPLVIIMIYFSLIGCKRIVEWLCKSMNSVIVRSTAIGFMVLLLLPNVSWLQSFIWNSWQYRKSPQNLYKKFEQEKKYPEMFAKPLHLAAQWIVQHSDSSAVVLSRWKEVALWLEGRRYVQSNPLVTPSLFDYQIRDYGVKFIVTQNSRTLLNEYETLFSCSQRFVFIKVARIGDIEVFEVKQKGTVHDERKGIAPDSTISSSYDEAMRILEDDPLKSEHILKELRAKTEGYGSIVFHIAVAKEFAGQLDSASMLFDKFHSLLQAGAFVEQSWYHQEIISRLRMAESATSSAERAQRFQTVAINYWELCYRGQAMKMLHHSLEADSNFFPALTVSAVFSIQQGDTATTRKDLEKARVIDPSNVIVRSLTTILRCADSLRMTTSPFHQRDIRFRIIDEYLAMGLRENVIDDLLTVLREDPKNPRALRMLADVYEVKRRYASAVEMYKRLVMVSPSDSVAETKLRELSQFCQ